MNSIVAFLGSGPCAKNQERDAQLGLVAIVVSVVVVTTLIFWKVILNKKLHVGWRILGFIVWLVSLGFAAVGYLLVSLGGACSGTLEQINGKNQTLKLNSRTLFAATILTRDAEDHMADIHDRRPIFLNEGEVQEWLDPKASREDLKGVLMASTDVNRAGNRDESFVEKIEL